MKHIGDVVCAIIEKDSSFLIAQRPADHIHANKWEFPGGKVKQDESSEDALQREIIEELGISVTIITPLKPLEHSYPGFTLRLLPFRCHINTGTPRALEHQELRWVTPESIDNYTLAEADRYILKRYLKGRDHDSKTVD